MKSKFNIVQLTTQLETKHVNVYNSQDTLRNYI